MSYKNRKPKESRKVLLCGCGARVMKYSVPKRNDKGEIVSIGMCSRCKKEIK